MSHLSLHLLGSFQVTLNSQPVKGFDSDRVRALLAYLAVEADRPHRRESLAGLLWPEQPDQTARNNLRYALSNLRRVIGDHAAEPPFLHITRHALQFNPTSDVWVDVTAFTQALPHQETPPNLAAITQMEETIALYRGDFLAGFSLSNSVSFEEWILFTREKLAQQAAAALRQLLPYYEQRGDIETAQAHARQLLQLEPWQEEIHQRLMRLLALNGQRGAALAQYQTCRQILADEMGIEPLPETTDLYNRIRDGQLVAGVGETSDKTVVFSSASLLPDPVANLHPFVARDNELAALDQALQTTLAGEGRVMLITGEAGSGKTTLIHNFVQQAMGEHRDLIVARGICNAYTGLGDPYLPFREIVQTLTGDIETKRAGGDLSSEHARRLWAIWPEAIRILLHAGSDLIDLFVLGDVLAYRAETFLSTTHQVDRQGQLTTLTRPQRAPNNSQPSRQDIFQQVTRFLHAMADHCPLVLVLDDLQWADNGSLNLLFHLSRSLANHRILILGAYRPTDVMVARGDDRHPLPAIVNEIKRLLGNCHLDLNQADGRQLIEAYLDTEPNRLGDSFRQTFFQQTGGNPLFMVELLGDLQANGVLVKNENDHWVEAASTNWQQLPTRIEAIIAERLGRLPETQQTLLRIACVEGEEFTAEVAARIQGVEPQNAIQILSEILGKRHQLVQSTRVQFLESGGQRLSNYRFRHNLFQQYLYSQLDEPERIQLHEAVGNALETFHHNQETPELAPRLAWHFEAAGLVEKAIGYRLRAGKWAWQMSAAKEAVDHFKQGLALLETLPDSPQKARLELDLQLNLGIVLTIARGWGAPERTHALERAYELAQQIGPPPPKLLLILAGFITTKAVQENWLSTLSQAEQLIDLAQQIQDPSYLALAYGQTGIGLTALGHHVRARNYLEQAIELYDRQQHPLLTLSNGIDIEVSSCAWVSLPEWVLGYPDQALAHSQKALALSRQLNHSSTTSIAFMHAIGLHILRGENLIAQTLIEESVCLAQEQDLLIYLKWVAPYQGWMQAEHGQVKAGITKIQTDIEAWLAIGSRDIFSQAMVLLAQTCAKFGQIEAGLETIDQAFAQVEDTGERFLEAEAYRTRGELLMKVEGGGMKDEAETCFLQAVEIAREQQARMWELRATISLARLWRQNGRSEKAHQVLAEIYNWFTEGFDTPDLQTARMLLEELSLDSE